MTVFKVKEMSCNHCVERISKALDSAGIKYDIKLEDKTVAIEGDEGILAQAVDELDDLGFSAQAVLGQ